MELRHQNTSQRKGKFMWMEPTARSLYVQSLQEKIGRGYFFSDMVVSKIVEDIAPILEEVACRE